MTPEETKQYLQQHWDLYLADEQLAAYFRAWKRLLEHVPTLGCQDVAKQFLDDLINGYKMGGPKT